MSIKKDNDEEFITKVFTNDDNSLKLLGELLSNQTSRDIIRLLIDKEMYANEIATRLSVQFNLLSHHLKKMETLGLVSINEKKITKKGQLHKYYKINPGIFLLPNQTQDKIKQDGSLRKIFKDSIKFAAIGIVSISLWASMEFGGSVDSTLNDDVSDKIFFPLLAIILGLVVERVWNYKKKEKG